MSAALRSGELADRAGVKVATLRYYERRGLLDAPARSLGGHRLYPPDTVAVLRVIKAAQRLGFTLDEVADLLDSRHGSPVLPGRAAAKLAEVEARIADLETVRGALHAVLDAGCASLTDCTCAGCPLPTEPASDHAYQR